MSINQNTIEMMKNLKLKGMRRAFETCLETRQCQSMTQDEFLAYLVQQEWELRQNQRITMALYRAKFRYQACFEQVNFTQGRNLNKNTIMRLADCSFIEKRENIIITGSTGVGKSYLASAFGHQACAKGFKVIYHNTAKLFTKLLNAKGDGTYVREIERIEKQDLLILDDFGLQPIDQQLRLALLEIIEDRHGKKATIIVSQIPVSNWYELLEEKTIADAILDRIVHTSHRIEMKGESMRKKQSAVGGQKELKEINV
jgi:DNA replication protein DnaC